MICSNVNNFFCCNSTYIIVTQVPFDFLHQDCVSSPIEKHGDGKESKTPVDQPSQDVTGSNPSVSNPCSNVTGPEPFYQRPEVRIAPLDLEGT